MATEEYQTERGFLLSRGACVTEQAGLCDCTGHTLVKSALPTAFFPGRFPLS